MALVSGKSCLVLTRMQPGSAQVHHCIQGLSSRNTRPPVEYATVEEATEALGRTGCPLACPGTLPAGYSLSLVREYGDPCPRRDIVYTRGIEELRLVQVCPGHPPYAFAITGKVADEVVIRGSPGKFVEGIGQNQLAWADSHGSYWLISSLPKEDLQEVAWSVKLLSFQKTPETPPPSISGEWLPS